MFSNPVFDDWLKMKSNEVLSKVNRESISNEEMLILILNNQADHVIKLDHNIQNDFNKMEIISTDRFHETNQKFVKLDAKIDRVYEDLNQKFDKLDTKMNTQFLWLLGMMMTILLSTFFHK